MLDREEMGEFVSAFDALTDGAVDLELRWMVAPQADFGPIDHSLDWPRLLRCPSVTLPEDFDEIDLKF